MESTGFPLQTTMIMINPDEPYMVQNNEKDYNDFNKYVNKYRPKSCLYAYYVVYLVMSGMVISTEPYTYHTCFVCNKKKEVEGQVASIFADDINDGRKITCIFCEL